MSNVRHFVLRGVALTCPPRIPHVLIAALLCATAAIAQSTAPSVTLAKTERRESKSAKIGQRYELLVSLPEDYATSGKSYPVLYVLKLSLEGDNILDEST